MYSFEDALFFRLVDDMVIGIDRYFMKYLLKSFRYTGYPKEIVRALALPCINKNIVWFDQWVSRTGSIDPIRHQCGHRRLDGGTPVHPVAPSPARRPKVAPILARGTWTVIVSRKGKDKAAIARLLPIRRNSSLSIYIPVPLFLSILHCI